MDHFKEMDTESFQIEEMTAEHKCTTIQLNFFQLIL